MEKQPRPQESPTAVTAKLTALFIIGSQVAGYINDILHPRPSGLDHFRKKHETRPIEEEDTNEPKPNIDPENRFPQKKRPAVTGPSLYA